MRYKTAEMCLISTVSHETSRSEFNGDKCGNRPSTMCDGNSGSNILCKSSEECSMCDCDIFTSFSQCECQWLHPDIVRSHAMHEMWPCAREFGAAITPTHCALLE